MKPYHLRRRIIEVRWQHFQGWAFCEKKQIIAGSFWTKKDAIAEGADFCRGIKAHGGLAELVIKNKDGEIGKGSGARRSYGKDPRSRRG